MAETTPATRRHIGVALSGGGHRASLFGLGAMLYLVDAGKGAELACVSSISGGSITNGYIGLATDLASVDPKEFRTAVAPLARAVSTEGTIWSNKITYVYLGSIVAILMAATIADFPLEAPAAVVVWIVALALVGWLSVQRSALANRTFAAKLFKDARLEDLHDTVDHVICASDLQTAEPVYFSGRFVNSFRLGWGEPGGLALSRAVQSSAALPGAFNPVKLPIERHRFTGKRPDAPARFILSDGGVYDNMGTEWVIRAGDRFNDPLVPQPPPNLPDELIVVNASTAIGVTARRSVRVPFLGEITTLIAVKDVLYDQTTSVRRRLLNDRFRHASAGTTLPREQPLSGTMVQIDRSPFDIAKAFDHGGEDVLSKRAGAALDALGRTKQSEDTWKADAAANASEKTALSKISADHAARLLRHGYVLTMINTHVLLDYRLLAIPDLSEFESLVR